MAFLEDILVQVIPGAPTVTRQGFGKPIVVGTTGQRSVAVLGSGNSQLIVKTVLRQTAVDIIIQTGAYAYDFTASTVTIDVPPNSTVRDLIADFNENAPSSVTDVISLSTKGTGVGEVTLTASTDLVFDVYREISALSQMADFYDETDDEYKMALSFFASAPRPASFYILDVFGSSNSISTDLSTYDDGSWYAVLTTSLLEVDLQDITNFVDTSSKLALFTTSASSTNIIDNVKSRRVAFLSHDDPNSHPEMSWAALNLPEDPGSITWKWRANLAKQVANTSSTVAELSAIRSAGGQSYISKGGVSFVDGGNTNPATGTTYIDSIRSQDWIKANIESDILQLFIDNGKIPFTNEGISQVVSIVANRLSLAGARGIIATVAGETAEVASLSRDGVYQFTVSAPTRAEIIANDPNDITNRVLPDVVFSYVEAGAIHSVSVTGRVVLSLA